MPYIEDKNIRGFLDDYVVTFLCHNYNIINDLAVSFSSLFDITGCLNYFLFKLAKHKKYVPSYTSFYLFIKKLVKINCKCYADYQSFMGELTCAKKEIERRLGRDNEIAYYLESTIDTIYDEIITPYENKKIKENGDIK